jgi:uncharacterized membrane protein
MTGRLRTVAASVVLAAVDVVLAATGVTTIPLPTGLSVSVLLILVALAGVLAGAAGGASVGLVLGLTTLTLAATPLFHNPVIAIVPRVVAGLVAALAFRLVRSANLPLALAIAGVLAAVANTGLVLLLATLLPGPVGAPYVSPDAAWDVARSNIPSEAILIGLVTLVVGLAARMVNFLRD